jgi:O-glycosyl hydrolase
MLRIRFCLTLMILAFFTGCQSAPPPVLPSPTPVFTLQPTITSVPEPTSTPTRPIPPVIPVAINAQDVRQVLREVGGGNYIHFFGGVTTALDPVSTMNLDTLHPQVVRVRIDLDEWEPKGGLTGEERFKVGTHVGGTFEFMKEVKSRNPETIIIASIWKVADWMVRNPEVEQPRIIPPALYPKVVDSIGSWLLRAKNEYGVEVNYVSFNEANIGVTVSLLPSEQVELIRQGGPQLQNMGLKTRWLLGDTANIVSSMNYIEPIYAAEDIRPYLGPLSFHSWDSNAPDSSIKEIGAFAVKNGLDVWCTEGGWDPSEWNNPSQFPTWRHAARLAEIYTRVLRDSRATTLLYWEMMGQDYYINDGSKPFPALVYLQELQRHFQTGAQIIGTQDDPILTLTILSLAAKTPDGGFSVELMNQVKPERRVLLSGLPDSTYTVVRLNEKDGRQELDPVQVKDGEVEITLAGQSIYFLKRK